MRTTSDQNGITISEIYLCVHFFFHLIKLRIFKIFFSNTIPLFLAETLRFIRFYSLFFFSFLRLNHLSTLQPLQSCFYLRHWLVLSICLPFSLPDSFLFFFFQSGYSILLSALFPSSIDITVFYSFTILNKNFIHTLFRPRMPVIH